MGQLKILAAGDSPQARAQARGKLFEKLMSEVLRQLGYQIDKIPNVNYAGMEIDIEGKSIVMDTPLYAECKCYENEVAAPALQAFFGKYMTRWLNDERSQGLFIALPGINSHAKGFFRENIEKNAKGFTVSLLEEERVLDAIFRIQNIAIPETIKKYIPMHAGIPGDWLLLYTEKGIFLAQYVIPSGRGTASRIAIFSQDGRAISEKATLDYLNELYPELNDFEVVNIDNPTNLQSLSAQQEKEDIVEVKGSSACFEYQFPASPEHFVGRQNILDDVDSFVEAIINKETSSRGILFEANSGWGKSSVTLAVVDRLRERGHFAVAIDSRSASSSQFILRAVDHALNKLTDLNDFLHEDEGYRPITGFEGAADSLITAGQILEKHNKIIFIFLDQFENLFYLHDALKRIRDLFLQVQDARTNVVLGFSWKSDLVSLASDFPYQTRDAIADSSKRITLNLFTNVETESLLKELSKELNNTQLRKDLKFFLSEFSQGYPWLLKKLCAHVKGQIESGTPQADIANSLLNIEELFQEDLKVLSAEEEDALRQIAKLAPIRVQELSEEFKSEVIQSLVHHRLLVRIGNKYDIYWDIFRDYLASGNIPIQENYVLRMQVGGVLKATKLLAETNRKYSASEFQDIAKLQKNSFYNVLRDMRLLGLVKIDNNRDISLASNLNIETDNFEENLRIHLQDRLRRNRLVWNLLNILNNDKILTMDHVAKILEDSCPYISAAKKTWLTYAKILVNWMDATDLSLYDNKTDTLSCYTPGPTKVRDQRPLLAKKRGGITPSIRYAYIEQIAIRLVEASEQNQKADFSGFADATVEKALNTLGNIGFIERRNKSIYLHDVITNFVLLPESRPEIFAQSALRMDSFATFVKILEEYKNKRVTLKEISNELKKRLGVEWKEITAIGYTRIMLNWAHCGGLIPKDFSIEQ